MGNLRSAPTPTGVSVGSIVIYMGQYGYYNIGKVLHVGPKTVKVQELRWKPDGKPSQWEPFSLWREPRWEKARVRLLTHQIEKVLTDIDAMQERQEQETEKI